MLVTRASNVERVIEEVLDSALGKRVGGLAVELCATL